MRSGRSLRVRGAVRTRLDLVASGRIWSHPVRVSIVDISAKGCRIDGIGLGEVGDCISLRLDRFNAPPGKIVWTDRASAGVSFDGELHQSILETLIRHHKAV